MNQDILLSKIVPNATDITWAQAYTTLNVYVTVSLENTHPSNSVASQGKDVLEKIQREFFALDEKSLENIKKAIENVVKTIEEEQEYSIIVGAIVGDILYIVIASSGIVVLKRGERVGIIASGNKNELVGFSGKLEHDDIVSFETGDFNKKIPLSIMQEYLSANDVSQISENLTPLVHEGSKGTEAAIILQFKNLDKEHSTSSGEEFVTEKIDEKPKDDEKVIEKDDEEIKTNLWLKPTSEMPEVEDGPIEDMADEITPPNKPFFSFLSFEKILGFFTFKNKRNIIILTTILLVVLLIGSIIFETNRRASVQRQGEFAKIYNPAKTTYDEGAALESLNKSLALEKLNDAQKIIQENLAKFPEDSKEYKDLASLLAEIEREIESIGGGGQVKNPQTLIKTSAEFSSIEAVTIKGGVLVIVSEESKKIATVKPNGDIDKTFDTDIAGNLISSDEKFVYVLGNGVERIDKGNGKQETILKEAKGSAIDLFGSNFYILNGDDIEKYRAPSSNSSSYFSEKPSFEANPISFSIDGSVWILEDNGSIVKFTKGKRETFEMKGLLAPFGANSQIYTDVDYANLYVLDVKNQRVVALSKKGEFQNQYEWNEFANANSFSIDEKNKKGYVIVNDTLNSFDL